MSREEYAKWRADCFAALTATRFTAEEAEIILDWFDTIKGSGEYDLLGHERFEAMRVYMGGYEPGWNLYDDMTSRMWMYARYILEEHKRTGG